MVIDGDTPEMDGQQDPKGSFGDRGSPILAETYAVVQIQMIRNPPLIHQGFIGYDAISQNIPRAEDQRAHGPRLPRRSTVDAGNAGQTRCHLMGGLVSPGTSPMVTVD